MEAQRNKFLSSKKVKTVISRLLEDAITDESDIDPETNSDWLRTAYDTGLRHVTSRRHTVPCRSL